MRISDWSSDVCSSDLHTFALRLYHRKRERPFQGGTVIGWSYVAGRDARPRWADDLRAFFQQDFRIPRPEAHKLFAARLGHRGSRQRSFAHKIRFRLADRPCETGVVRCHRAISLLPNDDITLLGP